jgi:hypothetical protein
MVVASGSTSHGLHPGVGVEFHGIELLREGGVIIDGDSGVVHDPFAEALDLLSLPHAGGDGVNAPVNEHAESRLSPPFHAGVALLFGFGLIRAGISAWGPCENRD